MPYNLTNYQIDLPKKHHFCFLFSVTISQKLLYNCLDLYIVSSRLEGGPASIMECALTKTPIISTDVGIANKILPKYSIFQDENYENSKPDIELAFSNVQKYIIPKGFNKFIKIFEEIYES